MKLSHYRDSWFTDRGLSNCDIMFNEYNSKPLTKLIRFSYKYKPKLSHVPPKKSKNCLHRKWNRLNRITLYLIYRWHINLSTLTKQITEINGDE